ncbi:hypothetical protein BJY04DRAFT_219113 [Aspergillus karnatakaensis]|uniref:oxidase ustYa family protein n=1 Tax=Aspergillus karnatakaensis TaxID=1810916 RepID=UPI003CCCEAA6
MADRESHEPLLEDSILTERIRKSRSLRRWFNLSNAIILCLSILSFLLIIRDWSLRRGSPPFHQSVFSPATEAVEYKTVVFAPFGEPSIYSHPPTDEGDRAWEALYNDIGISYIDAETAAKLPNKTAQIEGSDQYVIGLDVFHQLHCLVSFIALVGITMPERSINNALQNALRKMLYPDRYPMNHTISEDDHMMHIDHCIQSLRESITCTADISTIFWTWDAAAQKNLPNAQTTHTCRDFGKLQEWARERRVDTLPDSGLAVHNGKESSLVE